MTWRSLCVLAGIGAAIAAGAMRAGYAVGAWLVERKGYLR